MKILAAVMDVVFVKYWWRTKGYRITKIKKFLVYDPSKVTGWDIDGSVYFKKVKDD